jgi:hypothetical protein
VCAFLFSPLDWFAQQTADGAVQTTPRAVVLPVKLFMQQAQQEQQQVVA